MKKFNLCAALAAGLAVLGLASCGPKDEPTPAPSTDKTEEVKPSGSESTNPEQSGTNTPEVDAPKGLKVMTAKDAAFGGITLDLYLEGNGSAFLDCTTTMESMNALFDAKGTYTVEDGVLTLTVPQKEGDPVVVTSTYNEETKTNNLEYVLKGDQVITFNLAGLIPSKLMSGKNSAFGGVTVDLYLYGNNEAFFDATTTMESMNSLFDKKGTYTIENNVYTFIVGEETFTSTYMADVNISKLDYTLKGDQVLNFELSSPAPTEPVGVKFLTGTNPAFGGITLDLYVTTGGHVFLDCTTSMESMNTMFDAFGTAVYENGVLTITVPQANGDPVVASTTFDEATNTLHMAYVLHGQKDLEFDLAGKAPSKLMHGHVDDRGGIDVDLYLYGENGCFFDVTTGMEQMNKMLDMYGTYTLADNVYTFTVGGVEMKSVYNAENNSSTLDYVIKGPDATMTFPLSTLA